MRQLKELDYKILYELMNNAKKSDREIAKALGISQPTVSRKRAFLEKEVIDGYTVIPKWEKLGYRIFAMTFVKIKPVVGTKEEYADSRKRGTEWLMSQPYIVMSGGCRGMGVDAFNLSFHKSYSDMMISCVTLDLNGRFNRECRICSCESRWKRAFEASTFEISHTSITLHYS